MNKDYQNLSKRQLIKELQLLKKQKKYGLVWEEKTEEVVEKCKTQAPILAQKTGGKKWKIQDKDLEKSNNILIQGDNYHALQVLNYTHKEKVDVIYIDPPYNTGKEFIYNDKIVDKEDNFRHSKWLSFMEKRLKLAKNLLKKDGVIFISIDDNEQANLKLLCDEVFGEKNFESIVWKKKGGASNTEKILGNLTEYILCFFKNKKTEVFNYRHIEREYKFADKKGFYNLESVEKTNLGTYERKTMLFSVKNPNTKTIFKPSKDKRWTLGEKKFEELIKKEKIFFDENKKKVFRIKRAEDYELTKNVFYNLLTDLGSMSIGKDELKNLLNDRELFDTPKPTKLIKHLLEISSQKNSIILDFFAGSGTTGHAVLDLNKEDGGNRKFILVTNNENKICEKVTYKRLSKVIKGYKNKKGEKVEGLGGNLEYLKTQFVDVENIKKVSDKKKVEFTHQAGWMIALKEDCLEEVEKNQYFQIFTNGKDKFVGIYFRENLEKISELEKKLFDKKEVKLYIFSHGASDFSVEYESHKNVKVENIPEPILKIYEGLNK